MNGQNRSLPSKSYAFSATDDPTVPPSRFWLFAWYGTSFFLIVITALVKLKMPLHGDTSLFLYYAMKLDQGAKLYIDYWDIKPPGIFVYYLIAGKIFGFTETGVRTFELCWMLVLTVFMMVGLRSYFNQRWLSAVAPAALIAVYYAWAEANQMTQVEIVTALPTFTAAWLLAKAARRSSHSFLLNFLAGLAAAVSTVFKVVFAPIFILFVLIATADRLIAKRGLLRTVARLWIPFTMGVALVWGIVCAYFYLKGTFNAFVWTVFEFPLMAIGTGVEPAPISRLLTSFATYAGTYSPWLIFVLLTVPRIWRRDEPLLTTFLWSWLIIAVFLMLVQRFSWWSYHTLQFYTPTALLAVRGIDRALTFIEERAVLSQTRTMLAGALMVVPAMAGIMGKFGMHAKMLLLTLFIYEGDWDTYQRFLFVDHGPVVDSAAYLAQPGRKPGKIYVIGTPLYNILTGRDQAIPIPGWIWEFLLPEQKQDMLARLNADPPAYIFIEDRSMIDIDAEDHPFMAFVQSRYRLVAVYPFGRWYERIDGPDDGDKSGPGDH